MQTEPAATAQNQPNPPETIEVTSKTVGCDGTAGASTGNLGHPKVYLQLTKQADSHYSVECPYCDRKFVLAAGAAGHGH